MVCSEIYILIVQKRPYIPIVPDHPEKQTPPFSGIKIYLNATKQTYHLITIWTVSDLVIVVAQNASPQAVPLWYADCFELKVTLATGSRETS